MDGHFVDTYLLRAVAGAGHQGKIPLPPRRPPDGQQPGENDPAFHRGRGGLDFVPCRGRRRYGRAAAADPRQRPPRRPGAQSRHPPGAAAAFPGRGGLYPADERFSRLRRAGVHPRHPGAGGAAEERDHAAGRAAACCRWTAASIRANAALLAGGRRRPVRRGHVPVQCREHRRYDRNSS